MKEKVWLLIEIRPTLECLTGKIFCQIIEYFYCKSSRPGALKLLFVFIIDTFWETKLILTVILLTTLAIPHLDMFFSSRASLKVATPSLNVGLHASSVK